MNLDDFTVDRSGTLLDAAQTIQRNRSRSAVVTHAGKVVGILTEGDLLRALLHGATVYANLEKFVRHDFTFFRKRDETAALEMFRKHGFTMIPVIDGSFHLVDVILLADVLAKVELPG